VVGVVHNLRLGTAGKRHTADRGPKVLKSDDRIYAQYFLRLHVRDEVGVLAQLTGVLAQYGVSMEQVFQQPLPGTAADQKETVHQSSAANDVSNDVSEPEAEVILITHKVSKQSIEQVLATLQDTDILLNCKSLYRVEGGQS
jgi:homoserine dehydrogenase